MTKLYMFCLGIALLISGADFRIGLTIMVYVATVGVVEVLWPDRQRQG